MGWSDFFGNSDDAMAEATAKSNAALQAAEGRADRHFTGGLNNALSSLSQFGGGDATTLLDDALGVNGNEAMQRFYDGFEMDAASRAELDTSLQGINRSAAARGGLLSGNTLSALADRGRLFERDRFQRRVGNLNQLSGREHGVAQNIAGLHRDVSSDRAGLTFGGEQLRQGNSLQLAGHQAKRKQQGFGNALALGKLGISLAAAIPTGGLSLAGIPGSMNTGMS